MSSGITDGEDTIHCNDDLGSVEASIPYIIMMVYAVCSPWNIGEKVRKLFISSLSNVGNYN